MRVRLTLIICLVAVMLLPIHVSYGQSNNPPLSAGIGWSPEFGVMTDASGSVSISTVRDSASGEVAFTVIERLGFLYTDYNDDDSTATQAFKQVTLTQGRLWEWTTLGIGAGTVIGSDEVWAITALELGAHPIKSKLSLILGAERIIKPGRDGTFLYFRASFRPPGV